MKKNIITIVLLALQLTIIEPAASVFKKNLPSARTLLKGLGLVAGTGLSIKAIKKVIDKYKKVHPVKYDRLQQKIYGQPLSLHSGDNDDDIIGEPVAPVKQKIYDQPLSLHSGDNHDIVGEPVAPVKVPVKAEKIVRLPVKNTKWKLLGAGLLALTHFLTKKNDESHGLMEVKTGSQLFPVNDIVYSHDIFQEKRTGEILPPYMINHPIWSAEKQIGTQLISLSEVQKLTNITSEAKELIISIKKEGIPFGVDDFLKSTQHLNNLFSESNKKLNENNQLIVYKELANFEKAIVTVYTEIKNNTIMNNYKKIEILDRIKKIQNKINNLHEINGLIGETNSTLNEHKEKEFYKTVNNQTNYILGMELIFGAIGLKKLINNKAHEMLKEKNEIKKSFEKNVEMIRENIKNYLTKVKNILKNKEMFSIENKKTLLQIEEKLYQLSIKKPKDFNDIQNKIDSFEKEIEKIKLAETQNEKQKRLIEWKNYLDNKKNAKNKNIYYKQELLIKEQELLIKPLKEFINFLKLKQLDYIFQIEFDQDKILRIKNLNDFKIKIIQIYINLIDQILLLSNKNYILRYGFDTYYDFDTLDKAYYDILKEDPFLLILLKDFDKNEKNDKNYKQESPKKYEKLNHYVDFLEKVGKKIIEANGLTGHWLLNKEYGTPKFVSEDNFFLYFDDEKNFTLSDFDDSDNISFNLEQDEEAKQNKVFFEEAKIRKKILMNPINELIDSLLTEYIINRTCSSELKKNITEAEGVEISFNDFCYSIHNHSIQSIFIKLIKCIIYSNYNEKKFLLSDYEIKTKAQKDNLFNKYTIKIKQIISESIEEIEKKENDIEKRYFEKGYFNEDADLLINKLIDILNLFINIIKKNEYADLKNDKKIISFFEDKIEIEKNEIADTIIVTFFILKINILKNKILNMDMDISNKNKLINKIEECNPSSYNEKSFNEAKKKLSLIEGEIKIPEVIEKFVAFYNVLPYKEDHKIKVIMDNNYNRLQNIETLSELIKNISSLFENYKEDKDFKTHLDDFNKDIEDIINK